jgi:3-hydroxyisobutyrate dehydrogenase-like beta-hydroxyacid dehydrogenase
MGDSPIGLIGVGLLGTALAERMLAAGLVVVGFDRKASQTHRLRELGGQMAATPEDIAGGCERIVLCLPDSHIVADVINHFGDRLHKGALLIDATTGDPDDTASLAEGLAARGVGYVDATIAGSSQQVREGCATLIIGGAGDDVRRAVPVLSCWGTRRFHVGPAGSGARMKLIVNLVLGLNRAALAEGLALASACGIDIAAALKVLKDTPAYSAVMVAKGPKMVARDYEPQARLAQHLKDVRLIRELARRNGAWTPLSEVHQSLLETAVQLGYGEADNSAVMEALLSER